jgi:hypothetical protein
MTIDVYWASLEQEWLRANEPEPVYKNFAKNKKNIESLISFCPAVKEYNKNIFSLKSIYDYEFEINRNNFSVWSPLYDQKFYDNHIEVRSLDDKLFSFLQKIVFFTEKKSLPMSAGIFPYLEDNEITKRCITIPGKFDIGKWFRTTDFAFYLRDGFDSFKIKEGDVYQYLKFDTNERINFKQFKTNETINKYIADITSAKDSRRQKMRELSEFYSTMKHKKYIIKEIKNNLL